MEAPPALRRSQSEPPFSLTDWHRLDRSRRSCSDLSDPSGSWLVRRTSSSSQQELTAGHAPAKVDFQREDFVCKNVHRVREEYEFESCLGKGSFGQVYRARHLRTGVHRAVKELPKVGTLQEDFEWELRALIALDHPHIVQVVEHFEEQDKWFIVMELCTGPDLFTYIVENTDAEASEGPRFIPERDVSIILRQCLKAVLCCHAHGFVHRDLNAKNFMFTGSDMTVKLIDFGLATRFAPADDTEEIVGTAHYMAPEMMLNGQWTAAVDIWSLGVVLFVLLTGTMLLPKDDEKKRKLLKRANFSQLRLESCKLLKDRDLSTQARDLLQQMLLHDPAERVTASRALSHAFVWNFSSESLGPPMDVCAGFDPDVVKKLRRFALAPRLRKVALLIMTHLASAERHEDELLRAQHIFRTMDKDGDGQISLDELRQELAAHGVEAPPDLGRIFAICDSGGSGRLNFVEFVACILPKDFIDEQLCSEVFNVLDRDWNGRINPVDLQMAHPSYDLAACQEIISEADLTRKGYLDFDDFHRFMCGAPAPRARSQAELQADEALEPPHVRRRTE